MLFIIILLVIMLYVLYYKDKRDEDIRIRDNECLKSTYDNPYSNKMLVEDEFKERCNKDNMEEEKKNNLYNVYENSNNKGFMDGIKSLRIFYGIPKFDYNKYLEFITNKKMI